MEGQVSTEITQLNCKFITRLEKLKNLFEKDLQDQCEKNILFQQTQNWVDILSSYKDLEKAHNEFNMNNPGKQKKMDNFEIDLLKIVVKLYCNFLKIEPILMGVYDWDQIGSILFNRHWKVCRSKWLETQATSIVDHPWTREEDQILSNLYEKYSKSNKQNKWSLISIELSKMCKSAHVRQGKQCRERWINKLNPLVNKYTIYTNKFCLEVHGIIYLIKNHIFIINFIANLFQQNIKLRILKNILIYNIKFLKIKFIF